MNSTPPRFPGLLLKLAPVDPFGVSVKLEPIFGLRPTIQPIGTDLGWFYATATNHEFPDAASAFNAAHAALSVSGVDEAEPEIIGTFDSVETDAAFAPLFAAGDPTDGHYTWHLEQVRAIQARMDFNVNGDGVRVAHLDTGVTRHPELVIGSNINFGLGYNFHEDNNDVIEPLATIAAGHGTATGSVLVGFPGKQIQGGNAWVEGIAPGIELVPIRVDKNVWFFSGKNDAASISHALDKKCHVITMSRGGRNSGVLRAAVQKATRQGIIVVAAASNCNVGCGVFSPANYPEVVCVAGTTIGRTSWSQSSRGPEVTISAPAFHVYRARTRNVGENYEYTVARGDGTSFATPLVAGAAALWIQRHGGYDRLAATAGGAANIPRLFKHILTVSGYSDGIDWDASKFGPGILDCVALMNAPLSPIPPAPSMVPFSMIERHFKSLLPLDASLKNPEVNLLKLEIEFQILSSRSFFDALSEPQFYSASRADGQRPGSHMASAIDRTIQQKDQSALMRRFGDLQRSS